MGRFQWYKQNLTVRNLNYCISDTKSSQCQFSQVGRLHITFTKNAVTNAHGTKRIKLMLIAIAFKANQKLASFRGRDRIYEINFGERYDHIAKIFT